MWRRIWIIFYSRNKEYYRDRSALAWTFLFPFLVIIGFALLFSGDRQFLYKVGVIKNSLPAASANESLYQNFKKTKYIEFVDIESKESGLNKLNHHRIDMLMDPSDGIYWVGDSSPNGYIVQKLLIAGSVEKESGFKKEQIKGTEINYIEWLFPGVLGMNMMFSSLFGVGYVVVRYRKNGALKRMSVTPVKPYEFLTAQILSRMFVLLSTTAIVFAGTLMLFGFQCRGSYLSLIVVASLGGFSMVSLGLLVACRSSSEEFAGGVLNIISWPMMFISEVWFSLEGARPWVKAVSKFFPLTPMVDSARKIMNDGATLLDVKNQVMAMAVMSLVFLVLGSVLFKWQKE